MATTRAGTKGGLASKAPRLGRKPRNDPTEPKAASVSTKPLQKGAERAWLGFGFGLGFGLGFGFGFGLGLGFGFGCGCGFGLA